eukprot:7082018-Pyramimonas_sp.AAC.1
MFTGHTSACQPHTPTAHGQKEPASQRDKAPTQCLLKPRSAHNGLQAPFQGVAPQLRPTIPFTTLFGSLLS